MTRVERGSVIPFFAMSFVFVALLAGKPIGIVGMTVIGVKLGLRAPGGLTYPHAVIVGVTAAIGFTVALFFTTAAFEPGPVLDEAKMGALFSFGAAPAAILLGRLLGVSPNAAPPIKRAVHP